MLYVQVNLNSGQILLTYCRQVDSQFPLSSSPNSRENQLRLKNFNLNLILTCNIDKPGQVYPHS